MRSFNVHSVHWFMVGAFVVFSAVMAFASGSASSKGGSSVAQSQFTSDACILIEHLGPTDRVVYRHLIKKAGAPLPSNFAPASGIRIITHEISASEMSDLVDVLNEVGFFDETSSPPSEVGPAIVGSFNFYVAEENLPLFSVDLNPATSQGYLQTMQDMFGSNSDLYGVLNGLILKTTL